MKTIPIHTQCPHCEEKFSVSLLKSNHRATEDGLRWHVFTCPHCYNYCEVQLPGDPDGPSLDTYRGEKGGPGSDDDLLGRQGPGKPFIPAQPAEKPKTQATE